MIGTHTDGMTPTQKEVVSQELSRVIETWRYAFRGTSIQLIADEVRFLFSSLLSWLNN